MSGITVELSEFDADMWEAFSRGGPWVVHSEYMRVVAENAKLRELALGLKWCSENYGCENVCPLYDKSEPEHCREERLLRELGIEVDAWANA